MEHSERDSKNFFDVMWKSLREVLSRGQAGAAAYGNNVSSVTNGLVESFKKVKVSNVVLGFCVTLLCI